VRRVAGRTRGVDVAARVFRLWAPMSFLALVALFAVFGPHVLQDPHMMSTQFRFAGPSLAHPLGADEFGRDILSRLASGARLSLSVGFVSVAIASFLGVMIGVVAAYFRGWVEMIAMRFVDFMLSFPPVLLAILVVAFAGANVLTVSVTIGVLFIPRFARLVHSETLVLREAEFVEAERAIGRHDVSIIIRTLLPNMVGLVLAQLALALGQAILTETGLSYLGLGPPASVPSWGRSIQTGSSYLRQSVLLVLWPSLAISLTLISLNLLADWLSAKLDPRTRSVALGRLP
jgi:ABC-type dipeptide/oligopeptide/nickel transport system permease subunit